MGVTAAETPRRRPSIVRSLLLLLIAIAAMPNGLYFSPLFDSVLFMIPRASSAFFIRGQESTFYLTGLVLWLSTLSLAGIPAAVWDRVRGLPHGSSVSLLLWLAAAVLLSIPSLNAANELFLEP